MKRILTLLLVLISCAAVLNGCAVGRPAASIFQEIEQIPPDRGVVYITMPSDKNVMDFTEIFVENELEQGVLLYKLQKGYYVAYLAPLGENLFRLNNQRIALHVEQQQSYFIEFNSVVVTSLFSKKTEQRVMEHDPTVGFLKINNMKTLSVQPL